MRDLEKINKIAISSLIGLLCLSLVSCIFITSLDSVVSFLLGLALNIVFILIAYLIIILIWRGEP